MDALTPVRLMRTYNIEETKIITLQRSQKFLLPPKLTKRVKFLDDIKYKEYVKESLQSTIFLADKWNSLIN
jgi:hypothetical protein